MNSLKIISFTSVDFIRDIKDLANESDTKICLLGTSLVAQWLRIRLPMQDTRVRALVREDPTCHGVTKPMRHNY